MPTAAEILNELRARGTDKNAPTFEPTVLVGKKLTLQELADKFSRVKSTMTDAEKIAEYQAIVSDLNLELNDLGCAFAIARHALIRLKADLIIRTEDVHFGDLAAGGFPEFMRIRTFLEADGTPNLECEADE